MQVTGDWKAFKDVIRFPQHNERGGGCWMCRATPDNIRNTRELAP